MDGKPQRATPKPPLSKSATHDRAPASRRTAPGPSTGEPDRLARALGPGRMPRLLIRYPRICGIAMVAVGLLLWRDLSRVATEGGMYVALH